MIPLPATKGVSPEDTRLAWELVANISPLGDIMRRHGLTFDELDLRRADPLFRALLDQLRRQWNSDMTVNDRVRLKAALLTEDSLLDVYSIVKDPEATAGQKLEAFGAIAKAGEVGAARKDAPDSGTRVRINISIPGREALTLDAASQTPVED